MEIVLTHRRGMMTASAIVAIAALAAAVFIGFMADHPVYFFFIAIFVVVAVISGIVFLRERRKSSLTVEISPEGIKTADGELIPSDAIDSCYIHYCERPSGGGVRGEGIDNSFLRIVVALTDGRKRLIDIKDYAGIKDIESFHKEVNAIPGTPKFTAPVIERL